MTTPIWITPAGFLGTITESISTSLSVIATGTNINFSLISGDLPTGLVLNTSTGIISGVPNVVYMVIEHQFVIRAENTDGITDRTFVIDVSGPTEPQWQFTEPIYTQMIGDTQAVLLGFTDLVPGQTAPYVVNKQYIDFQLTATTDILPPGKQLFYYIGDNDGQLPNGVTITDTGRIFGYVQDSTIIDYVYSINAQYDTDPYSNNPYDYTSTESASGLNYYDKVYPFRVTVTDGIIESTQTFIINVKDPAYLYTLVEQPGNNPPLQLRYPVPAQWLMEKDLGLVRSNNRYLFDLKAYDPYPGYGPPLVYSAITPIPENWTLNVNTDTGSAVLYGQLPFTNEFETTYTFNIDAKKTYTIYNTTATTTATFTLRVLGDTAEYINFITPQMIGVIRPGEVSSLQLQVQRDDSMQTTYRMLSGQLPDGLMLETDGSIVGVVSYSTSTQTAYNFSVRAEDVQRQTYVEKEFTLTVDRSDSIKYTNIYLRPFMSENMRDTYYDFVSSPNLIDPKIIYRPLDPNFGVQKDIKFSLYNGIELTQLSLYAGAMSDYFYNKQLLFGDVKYVVAKTLDNTVNYEMVYVEVIDDLINDLGENISYETTSTGVVYYPNSLHNMRSALEDIVIDSRKIYRNEYYIPLYEKTVQDNTGVPPKFLRAIPICYVTHGNGAALVKKIKNSNFDFKLLKFMVDRLVIEKSEDNAEPQYLIFPRKIINKE